MWRAVAERQMWIEETVVVQAKDGLHARPARAVWEQARKFTSQVRIRKGSLDLDAKSIFDIMRLNATFGTELLICAEGDDAKNAVQALGRVIRSQTD